jgi:predicted RNase H-like HicB family nuclease
MVNKYGFNIAWSDEDQGYIVTCPEFSGLSAFGLTVEEALAQAQDALGLFIKTYQEDGLPLPEPQTIQVYSGQFRVRMAKDQHRQAALAAAREGISLNRFVENAVAFKLGATDLYTRLIEGLMQKVQDLSKQVARNSMVVASYMQHNEQHGTQDRKTVRTSTEITTERTTYSHMIDLTKGN